MANLELTYSSTSSTPRPVIHSYEALEAEMEVEKASIDIELEKEAQWKAFMLWQYARSVYEDALRKQRETHEACNKAVTLFLIIGVGKKKFLDAEESMDKAYKFCRKCSWKVGLAKWMYDLATLKVREAEYRYDTAKLKGQETELKLNKAKQDNYLSELKLKAAEAPVDEACLAKCKEKVINLYKQEAEYKKNTAEHEAKYKAHKNLRQEINEVLYSDAKPNSKKFTISLLLRKKR